MNDEGFKKKKTEEKMKNEETCRKSLLNRRQKEVRMDPRRIKTWNETRRQLMAMIEKRKENRGDTRRENEKKELKQETEKKDENATQRHQETKVEPKEECLIRKQENIEMKRKADEREKIKVSHKKGTEHVKDKREIKKETKHEKDKERTKYEKGREETKEKNVKRETKHYTEQKNFRKEIKHEKNKERTKYENGKEETKHKNVKKEINHKKDNERIKHEKRKGKTKDEFSREKIDDEEEEEEEEAQKPKETRSDKKNKWQKLKDAKHKKRKLKYFERKILKKAKKKKDKLDKEQGVRRIKKKIKWNSRVIRIMDVDLLRPGTVPISPDTSLWFEFLLNPNLLEKHLENPFADPTPTDMIIKFLTLSMTPKPADEPQPSKPSKKALALKLLALKVAAYLKWDLKLFESKLHLSLQAALLRDFLNVVSDKYGDITTHTNIDFSQLEAQEVFVIFIYHRWVLRTFRNAYLSGKIKTTSGLVQSEICDHVEEFCFHKAVNEINAERSYIVLKNISTANLKFKIVIPTISTITPLTESVDEAIHKWNVGKEISIDQFQCQLFMDMTNYLMYRENYSEAKKALQLCCTSFEKWKKEKFEEPFSTVTSETISSRCLALGISTNQSPSLVEQYHKLVSEHYMGIEKVFEKDNLTKEIPMLYRDCLELDITSEINTGKITVYRDTLMQIQASNQVRRALEGGSWQTPKVTPSTLQNALIPVITNGTETELNRLKYLVGNTLVNGDFSSRELALLPTTKQLLTEDEINSCVESDYMDIVPEVLSMDLDKSLEVASRFKSPNVRMAAIERTLISSYDSADIETAISQLNVRNNVNVGQLNRNWELPGSVAAAIPTLSSLFLQQYIFVLLAKAYELDSIENYSQAKALMRAAIEVMSKEEPNAVAKLTQLIKWEILLVEIHEFHSEWPAKRLDWSGLGQKCIQVLNKVEGLLPRIALKEECALTLLNTGQWASLTSSPQLKHSSVALADLYSSIASACEDMNKFNVKISTDVWDKVLSMLATYGQKRQGPAPILKAFSSIVDLNGLVVVISILAKIHNILIEQPQLELQVQLSQVWPTTIKNSNQLNLKYVSEVLMDVLDYALKLAPNNLSWLKLKGDLHFANGNYSSALRSYIEAAIAGSDYFSRPLNKSPSEDYVYKRMIKSCTALQCYTQAGILCQFLDEVDYTTAFKSLSEGCCNDAMDSYYDCIWDVNILEFLIYLHTKRGEHHRKQKVIRTIGLLELNANNNDEIKREAENLRKGRFLRAMAAQYLS